MARAPDERQEQAKELFLQGMKLIDISKVLGVPVGTIRSWKNRYNWDERFNGNVAKEETQRCESEGAVSQATKTLLETMAALPQKEIRMPLPQESSKLSF